MVSDLLSIWGEQETQDQQGFDSSMLLVPRILKDVAAEVHLKQHLSSLYIFSTVVKATDPNVQDMGESSDSTLVMTQDLDPNAVSSIFWKHTCMYCPLSPPQSSKQLTWLNT